MLCALLCLSCSHRALHEAQSVVAEADSLRTVGQLYPDSTQLAQTYTTLGNWQYFYPDDYAHACYHYGRILRNKDNPAEAMQAFINATHSRTKDYHILGRVYSNMGTICHLAGEFSLSYEMYKQSADFFLRNADTTLYYLGVNNMAFEAAELKKKNLSLTLIQNIQDHCTNDYALAKSLETKAELYRKLEQYDSAIVCINILQSMDYQEPAGFLIKAQAFDELGVADSALYYAESVLAMPYISIEERYNVLYITTHYNPSIDNAELLQQTSHRADVGIEMDHKHAKNTKAAELLNQALQHKPYQKSMWALGISLVISFLLAAGLIGFFAYKKKELKGKTIQELHKQRIIQNNQRVLTEENDLLKEQNLQLKEQQTRHNEIRLQQIHKNFDILKHSNNILGDINWKNYDKLCDFINHHFFLCADKLKATQVLSEKEIRLLILVLLGFFTDKQMAEILYYSNKTIRSTKRNIAIKLGTTSANLHSWLVDLAIQ